MNFFFPGFFNSINKMPKQILSHLDTDTMEHHDTTSVSTALLTLLVLMTTVEAVVLILCTFYSWFKLPFTDFRWIDDEESDISEHENVVEKAKENEDRFSHITESLEERIWNEVQGESECPICLNEFQLNDVVVSSADNKCCQHVFHKKCLYRWFQVQSTCPCCRQNLIKMPVCKTKWDVEPRIPMTTPNQEEDDITVSLTTPWSPEARPVYVPFEDAWGFCLFLF
jgi:hypothetical protein